MVAHKIRPTDPAAEPSRGELIARLGAAPDAIATLARAVAAANPEAARGAAGEWSVRQVVAHLALVEAVVFQPRLDQLAAPDGGEPHWSWTEPGTAATPEVATLEAALATFAGRRLATIARVTALDEPGWASTGVHATFGRLDVAGLLGVIADHDEEHRAALEARGRAAS